MRHWPLRAALALLVAMAAGGMALAAGVRTEIVAFQHSAFPFAGRIPETGALFLDVREGDRRGHTSPRGGVYWEEPTYRVRSVLLAVPDGFDPGRPAAIVVFFHGNQTLLERDVIRRQRVIEQLGKSGVNAVLVAPQLAADALDSSAGRFWDRGFFRDFLGEAGTRFGKMTGQPAAAFASLPVIVVAYSGGYLPLASSLAVGQANDRVRGVILFDAAYGEIEKFAGWAARNRGAFLFSAYGPSSAEGNAALRRMLERKGIAVATGLPGSIGPGQVTLFFAGDVPHRDFMSRAWTNEPLAWVLGNVAAEVLSGGR